MKIYNLQFTIYKKVFLTLLVVVYCLLFMTLSAKAFSAELVVDTGRESVNALEMKIHVPKGVRIAELYEGNSPVLIWLKRPVYDELTQTISFSGITPGGFSGEWAVLTLSGEFSEGDFSAFTFSDVQALKNDGLGISTEIKISLRASSMERDETPPEPFEPMIAQSEDLFDGRHFISFATQDKGTGIERYEYAPTWFMEPDIESWTTAESPIALSSSELFKRMHIKAIDYSGNQMQVSIAGPYRYASILFGIIIMLCVLLLLRRSFRSRFP